MVLLSKLTARFSELNKLETPSDQFNFHLKTLLTSNLVEKTDKGLYKLTNLGKEFANRFDTDQGVVERQAKIGVLICCVRKDSEKKQFLLQQRLKQPYFGYWGFITGKVRWGQGLIETAIREFREETGLSADFSLAGIKHKTDYDKNGLLLEDKFFFVIKGENPKGKLKSRFDWGKNKWIDEDSLLKTKNLFPDVETTLRMAESKQIKFHEFKVAVEKY